MIRRGVLHACLAGSLALCLLLLFVGWQKATDSSSLREALLAHQVLPAAAVPLAARVLPWVEIAAGFVALMLLLRPQRRRSGALLLSGIFGALTAYVLLVWMDPPAKPTSCGCGLSNAPISDWRSIVLRNAAMTLVPLILAFFPTIPSTGSSRPSR